MPTRRDLALLGAAAFARPRPGMAAASEMAWLETRLFNFKQSVPAKDQQETLARLAAVSKHAGAAGFIVGRNIVQISYPTRFEWMSMIQRQSPNRQASAPLAPPNFGALAALGSQCSGDVACDLRCSLPARYADAAGVHVRHTVMFDFKPTATPAARARSIDAIRGMGNLPMVQRYLVEPSAANGMDPDQMQWQVTGDFASLADYQAYAKATVHLAIRQDFRENTARVTFLDVAV